MSKAGEQRNWNERQNSMRIAVNKYTKELAAGLSEEMQAEYWGLSRDQYNSWLDHSTDLPEQTLVAVYEKVGELDRAEQIREQELKELADRAQYYTGHTLRDEFRDGSAIKYLNRR